MHLAYYNNGNFNGAYCGTDIDEHDTTSEKSKVTCRYCLPKNWKLTKEFTMFIHCNGAMDAKVCRGKSCYCTMTPKQKIIHSIDKLDCYGDECYCHLMK